MLKQSPIPQNINEMPPTNPIENKVGSLERKSFVKGLLEPLEYLPQNTGKDLKIKLILAFEDWLKVSKEDTELIIQLILTTHRTGLLIDDIQDDTDIRRGAPAAHKVFGTPLTISSACYAQFIKLTELIDSNRTEMLIICIEELKNLHYGQGLDIYSRDAFVCHTEEEYIEMVKNKTGALLVMAIRLMQASSKSKIDYTDLVHKLGIFFQIRSDYLNLCSKDFADNQGYCSDIEEGKFSFPVVHSIQSNPSDSRLLNILKKRTKDTAEVSTALKILEQTGSLRYAYEYLTRLEKEIRSDIEQLGGNKKLEDIVNVISMEGQHIYID